jgi:hypothetical protein
VSSIAFRVPSLNQTLLGWGGVRTSRVSLWGVRKTTWLILASVFFIVQLQPSVTQPGHIKGPLCIGGLVYLPPTHTCTRRTDQPFLSDVDRHVDADALQPIKPASWYFVARSRSPTHGRPVFYELRERLCRSRLHRRKEVSYEHCFRSEDHRPVGRSVCDFGALEYVLPSPDQLSERFSRGPWAGADIEPIQAS